MDTSTLTRSEVERLQDEWDAKEGPFVQKTMAADFMRMVTGAVNDALERTQLRPDQTLIVAKENVKKAIEQWREKYASHGLYSPLCKEDFSCTISSTLKRTGSAIDIAYSEGVQKLVDGTYPQTFRSESAPIVQYLQQERQKSFLKMKDSKLAGAAEQMKRMNAILQDYQASPGSMTFPLSDFGKRNHEDMK